MIAKILHVCNTAPDCFGSKEDFYALKSRLLGRYGAPDGYDVQKISGKECWSCNGTGVFTHMSGTRDTCFKCYGSGWHKHPVWVTLKRYRWGRYVFHTPEDRSYKEPQPDVTNIHGYIRHPHYSWRKTRWAAIALALLCERKFFWPLFVEEMQRLWVVRVCRRRCIDCECHTWSTSWRCRDCEKACKRAGVEEIPF